MKFYEIKTDQRENEKLMEVSTESMNSRSTKKTLYINLHKSTLTFLRTPDENSPELESAMNKVANVDINSSEITLHQIRISRKCSFDLIILFYFF